MADEAPSEQTLSALPRYTTVTRHVFDGQDLTSLQAMHLRFKRCSFAGPDEIDHATRVATAQLNARARPWIWVRPQPTPRSYRRHSVYALRGTQR
ncbi:hypothetical protein AB0J63_30575 [Streptosporangium canum]|uniref:hypothetical protein n=1 Tax=Streptosporangium canum TaxID=324952 RepID=UPI00342BF938